MIATLKILHYLAFSVGIGGGIANVLAGRIAGQAGPAVAAPIGRLQARIGLASALALVVLWVTGLWLTVALYPAVGALPTAFWVKIVAVLALTATAAILQRNAFAARRTGRPPPPAQKWLGVLATGLAVVAVIFAAIAFTT